MDPRSFYQPGVPREITLPTDSLVEVYETAVAEGSNQTALDFFGRTTSYAELGDQIARAAEGLRRLGVRPRDRVALVLPNCPQHVVAFYAILRLGAIVVEHNPLYTPRELRHIFENHSARVVIAWDVAVEKLRSQPGDIRLDHIISVNLLDEFPRMKRLALKLPLPGLRSTRRKLTKKVRQTIPWKSLLKNRGLKTSHPRPKASDIAAIQYTSGTTGLPKGAILSHLNLYANARQGEAWMPDIKRGSETFYAILPFFHGFGMTMYLIYSMLKLARMHVFPTFDLSMVMGAVKKHPPTVLCAVPPIFEAIAASAKRRRISLRSVRLAMSGAMSLPVAVTEVWEKATGGQLIEGYGMTESSPVALGNPFYPTRRPGTLGLPFPSTEVRVVDAEDSSIDLAPGERGELLIRGPQVFQGYWNNPDETAATLLPGGWLASGDIVTQDEDGFVTIVDRKKELVVTSGFNVSPTEVEIVLKSHPAVEEAAVVGLPHPHAGEQVVAAIIPADGQAVAVEELRSFCRDRLAAYKVPRQIVSVEALPNSLLGKVLRGELRSQLLAQGLTTEPKPTSRRRS